MPLRLLLDENLRYRSVAQALAAHQATGIDPLDCERIGDPGCLPRGSTDDQIIAFAAAGERILISLDVNTLPDALASFLVAGGQSPGIVFLRNGLSVKQIVDILLLIAHASDVDQWQNSSQWQP